MICIRACYLRLNATVLETMIYSSKCHTAPNKMWESKKTQILFPLHWWDPFTNFCRNITLSYWLGTNSLIWVSHSCHCTSRTLSSSYSPIDSFLIRMFLLLFLFASPSFYPVSWQSHTLCPSYSQPTNPSTCHYLNRCGNQSSLQKCS